MVNTHQNLFTMSLQSAKSFLGLLPWDLVPANLLSEYKMWIWPYSLFLISGIVRTNAVLDRETTSRYWLTIYARDKGTVPRSSYVEVYVEVQDVNDNTPQTQDPVYYPSVPENSPEGTSVIKLVATDMDSSSNNQVRYAISSGNPQGFFTIDTSTGKYIFAELLEWGVIKIYSFLWLPICSSSDMNCPFPSGLKNHIPARFFFVPQTYQLHSS